MKEEWKSIIVLFQRLHCASGLSFLICIEDSGRKARLHTASGHHGAQCRSRLTHISAAAICFVGRLTLQCVAGGLEGGPLPPKEVFLLTLITYLMGPPFACSQAQNPAVT